MSLEPGSVLHHRYRIESTLGQGGMGAVYRASDVNLGVAVAVKENLFTTEEYARQFRREATILASLRHPNLPRVTDHFVIEGKGQYLVMDFVEGEDVRQRLERLGPVREQEALPWFLEICDALIYLHTRTPPILHRDIKPGNIKITPEGRAILVDFGLAKVADDRGNTTTGAKAMTPGFSPPEQYGSGRTDPRSDVYSLGATMYAALTAAVPEDSLERAMGRATLTPVRKRNPEATSSTARAIEKALEVRSEERYQSAAEFASALSSTWGASRPTMVRNYQHLERTLSAGAKTTISRPLVTPAKGPRRRWIVAGLGALAFVLVAAGASYAAPELKARLAALLVDETPTQTVEASPFPSITPTTGFAVILPSANPGDGTPAATLPPLPATITPVIPATAAQTPTGGGVGQIAFASDRDGGVPQIFLINLDGTGLFRVTTLEDGACQPSFSPDGSQLVFTSPCRANSERYPGSSLWVINTDRSGLRALPTRPGGDYDPAWSPDGTRIAFTSERDSRAQIYVMNVDGTDVRNLSNNQAWDSQPVWSPTGDQILYTNTFAGQSALWIMQSDGQSARVYTRGSERDNSHASWSMNGDVVVFEQVIGGIPRLVAADFEDSIPTPVQICQQGPRMVQPMAEPSWSLDSKWLVFETWPTGREHDIAIMSYSCTNYFALTGDAYRDFDAAWRP